MFLASLTRGNSVDLSIENVTKRSELEKLSLEVVMKLLLLQLLLAISIGHGKISYIVHSSQN